MSKPELMGIINLTPDSFYAPSRALSSEVLARMERMAEDGASIVDFGAVSTRPGAEDVSLEDEWSRLAPVMDLIADPSRRFSLKISVDTFRSEIVRRCYDVIGEFVVNDISSGEDDERMLPLVAELGLEYIAMHKRGNPRTMDALCSYTDVVSDILQYFRDFDIKAGEYGIRNWILDPGLGFAKTHAQNWEILERLPELRMEGHKILIGASDKRFTAGDNKRAHLLAARGGADILRVHDVAASRNSLCPINNSA